jgi:hypothetical protein
VNGAHSCTEASDCHRAPLYSLLSRDQLVAALDSNTRAMETFGREIARLTLECDALRADAEMYRALIHAAHGDVREAMRPCLYTPAEVDRMAGGER